MGCWRWQLRAQLFVKLVGDQKLEVGAERRELVVAE